MRDIRGIITHVPPFGTQGLRMVLVVAVAAGVLAGCSSRVDEVIATVTPSPPTPSATTPPEPIHDPAITIETPLNGGEVGSPVSVTGTADVAGDRVTVSVLDGAGHELAAIEVDVECKHECPGTFATELFYFVEHREPGSIQVSGDTPNGPAASTVPVVLAPA